MPASLNIPASMASGVTKSGFATSLAPKVVGDVAASGAASLGLGTLLGALGPAYTIYSVLDALGFFDKGMEATPMTPEEAAEYEATSRLALAQSGMQEGGEGAYEMLMDAVEQAAQTGLLSNEDIGVAGKWYDPETGEELPDFDPKTGKGMGTLFPIFQPDPVSTAGGGGGGGDTAASAASSEAASAASSQADSAGIGDEGFTTPMQVSLGNRAEKLLPLCRELTLTGKRLVMTMRQKYSASGGRIALQTQQPFLHLRLQLQLQPRFRCR
jgi:hypothetical protein